MGCDIVKYCVVMWSVLTMVIIDLQAITKNSHWTSSISFRSSICFVDLIIIVDELSVFLTKTLPCLVQQNLKLWFLRKSRAKYSSLRASGVSASEIYTGCLSPCISRQRVVSFSSLCVVLYSFNASTQYFVM